MTGAGSGIGRAIAAELVARGSHVVIADLDPAKAQAVAGELGAGPRQPPSTSPTPMPYEERALLVPPTDLATAATEPFTQMMQPWIDAFSRFGGESAGPRSS